MYEFPAKINKPKSQVTNGRGRANFRGIRGQDSCHSRGRDNYRGSRGGPTARRSEYDDDRGRYGNDEYEQQEGKMEYINNNLNNNERHIEFIADSGATEHIINKSFILSDFKISEKGVIKSANKNDFVDIVIDGKEIVYLRCCVFIKLNEFYAFKTYLLTIVL